MREFNYDELVKRGQNKFLLSNAAAGRAKQIIEGSLPYVNNFDPTNPIVTALREIMAEKIDIKVVSAPKLSKNMLEKSVEKEEKPSALERLAKGAKTKATKTKASKTKKDKKKK